ncbi:hypothetical protein ACJX0J_031296 [Zea mays]
MINYLKEREEMPTCYINFKDQASIISYNFEAYKKQGLLKLWKRQGHSYFLHTNFGDDETRQLTMELKKSIEKDLALTASGLLDRFMTQLLIFLTLQNDIFSVWSELTQVSAYSYGWLNLA